MIATYGRVMRDDDHINVMNNLIQGAVGVKAAGAAPVELGPQSSGKVEEAASAAHGAAKAAEAAATAAAGAQSAAEQAKAAAEEASSAAKAAAEAPAAVAPPNTTLYAVMALIVGLLVGAGGVFLTRQS